MIVAIGGVKFFCTVGECDREIQDMGTLMVHLATEHQDLPAAIEIRPRGRRRRSVPVNPPPVVPITDYLTEQSIQELETLTSQADSHLHAAVNEADQVRAAAKRSSLAIQDAKNRVLALHHRVMQLRPDSKKTRDVAEANTVAPPTVVEVEDDAPEDVVPEGPAGITVVPLGEPQVPLDADGPITNESLMQELQRGQARGGSTASH